MCNEYSFHYLGKRLTYLRTFMKHMEEQLTWCHNACGQTFGLND